MNGLPDRDWRLALYGKIILRDGGSRNCDGVMASHAEDGRACIQAAQLEVKDGRLVCNRNQQFEMRL